MYWLAADEHQRSELRRMGFDGSNQTTILRTLTSARHIVFNNQSNSKLFFYSGLEDYSVVNALHDEMLDEFGMKATLQISQFSRDQPIQILLPMPPTHHKTGIVFFSSLIDRVPTTFVLPHGGAFVQHLYYRTVARLRQCGLSETEKLNSRKTGRRN